MPGSGGPVATFSVWDYVVFAGLILFAAGIGLFQAIRGRKKASSDEFLLGGRQMTAVPVALSLTASFMSGITVIGTPAEAYMYGTPFWLFVFSYTIMSTFSAELFVPLFYRLSITSTYEYLEMRFNKLIRVIGTSMYIVQTGGLKAVIWTDVFQMIIMLSGFVAVIARGAVLQGGFAKIWNDSYHGGRLETFRSLYLNMVGLWVTVSLAMLSGLTMYSIYKDCDPFTNKDVGASDQLLPYLVMDILAEFPGLPGLFVAAAYSGTLRPRPALADNWYSLSYLYFCPVGIIVTMVTGLIVSAITGGCKQEKARPELFIGKSDLFCFGCRNSESEEQAVATVMGVLTLQLLGYGQLILLLFVLNIITDAQRISASPSSLTTTIAPPLNATGNHTENVSNVSSSLAYNDSATTQNNLTTPTTTLGPNQSNVTGSAGQPNTTEHAQTTQSATSSTFNISSTAVTSTDNSTHNSNGSATSSTTAVTQSTAITSTAVTQNSSASFNGSQVLVILGHFVYKFGRSKERSVQYTHRRLQNEDTGEPFALPDDTLVISGGLYDGPQIYNPTMTVQNEEFQTDASGFASRPTQFCLEFLREDQDRAFDHETSTFQTFHAHDQEP
ncbi:hypothetical protein cypCar_00006233 [Cyprinus carpio]|nr:hypothetical protein cypCar_00006233 [Cyprinus carpio]